MKVIYHAYAIAERQEDMELIPAHLVEAIRVWDRDCSAGSQVRSSASPRKGDIERTIAFSRRAKNVLEKALELAHSESLSIVAIDHLRRALRGGLSGDIRVIH